MTTLLFTGGNPAGFLLGTVREIVPEAFFTVAPV